VLIQSAFRRAVSSTARTVAAVGAVLLVLEVLFFLGLAHGDPSKLVHAAPPQTNPATAPAALTVGPQGTGFDGQFYFRQARAPISTAHSVDGITLDLPALRSERIVYPLLAAALSFGRVALLPWSLIVVNVLAGVLLVGMAARIARAAGHAPLWGLVVLGYPGFVYTVGFDLSELAATALLAAGLLALMRERWALVAATWSLALLTRETAAVLPLAAFVVALVPTRQAGGHRLHLALAGGVPLVVAAIWQIGLRQVFGSFPVTASGSKNIGLPFEGLAGSASAFAPTTPDGLFRLISLATLVVIVGVGVACLRTSRVPTVVKAAFVVEIVIVSTLSSFVWAGATSFMRAGSELALLGLVVAATSTHAVRTLLPVTIVGATVLTLASQVLKA
jgi:hypothetical protein